MYYETYENCLNSLHCDDETSVQYYDSRVSHITNEWLDEQALLDKLVDVSSLVHDTAQLHRNQRAQAAIPPFILISVLGVADFGSKQKPLRISQDALRTTIDVCGFPRQLPQSFELGLPHVSYYVHYENGSSQAEAISFIARVPRNNQAVTIASRMRLRDKACVSLLIATKGRDAAYIRDRCIEQKDLLAYYPFYPTIFLLDQFLGMHCPWLRKIWDGVDILEQETGMTPWMRPGGMKPRVSSKQDDKDYGQTLQRLHAVNVELNLAETAMKFGTEFVKFCSTILDLFERTQKELGLEGLSPSQLHLIEGEIRYNEKLCHFTSDKFHELLSRVGSQINVTYSLIAQQDSKTSTRIAESAARDNQTMNALTVIALVFLPTTLLASIWSSGIFSIDLDLSWRIYLGSCIGLTAAVFFAWIVIMHKTNAPRPSPQPPNPA